MSRFKRIKDKSNKKSSVSIDEKIVALNKELEKTGMLSEVMMTTSNVNSTSEYVPPQEAIVSPVPDTSGITGAGFEQSSAGSGTEGDAPTYSSTADLFNITANATIFPSTNYEGAQGYGVVIGPSFGAGTSYGIIEGGNKYRQVLGGWLAGGTRGPGHYKDIYINKQHANVDNPGTYTPEQIADAREDWQLAVQVDEILTKIGYDNTLFNKTWKAWRSPILWEDLSSYPVFEGKYLVPFNMLGTKNNYVEQDPRPETTTNPQRRGLEDEPIYPGPIPPGLWPPLSPGAFNALKEKARAERERAERERIEKERLEKERLEKQREEEEKEEQEEFDAEREKLYQENIRKLAQLLRMSEAEFIFLAEKLGYMTYLRNILYAKDPVALKIAHKFMVDQYHILSKALGVISRLPTAANMLVTYDRYIGSGKTGPIDVTNQVDRGSMRKLSAAIRKAKLASKMEMDVLKRIKETGEDRLIKAPNYILDKSGGGYTEMRESEQALRVLAGKIKSHLQNVTKPNITIAGFDVGRFLNPNLQQTFHNNVQIDMKEFIKSKGKNVVLTKTYQFRGGGSTEKSEKQWWGKALSAMGVELDRGGTGIYALPAMIASYMTLKNVGVKHGGKAYKARGMPMRVRIPSDMTNLQNSFSPDGYLLSEDGHLLSEGVGLGLYEPEAMNVDLADIRKGVMPEYPKKPPAEMIDGYHQDSKLKPKEFKDKYLLKIDEKDLIRNHRLKKGEADEMMNTIKMINDHLKKHPEDLIYVQQRYPIDDPRLAELNWKMDQMLEAGENYLDKNFKENQTLYKRATDRTKKNIQLTDPEYVQQHYDELRGTTKPKKTKLVGRLGKHLNKYESKSLFKHVNSKNFKKISERKLEKKKFLEKQEQERLDYINDINAEMDEFRSDWRNELKEQPVFKAVPVDTGKMTSSQSFAVFTNFGAGEDTGLRFSVDGGLGLDNSGGPNIFQYPTEAGGTVPAIDFSTPEGSGTAQISLGDFPLSGYAMPLGGKMSRSINQKKSEEINKELESSEEFTKKIEADALMKARVDSNIMTGNNLQDITTSFENVKVPFDQGKFSSYMRTNIEQFQTLGAYESEIEVLEHKLRKISTYHPIQITNRVATGDTEEARNKNYAKIKEFEKQIKQIKEKQRNIPDGPKYPKTKISQAQFDALLKEISSADYIEGEEILKNNFLGQLEKQKKELNKKIDSLMKKYPQFNGDPERILGKWNGSVQIPIFDSDNNEIKPIGAEIGKQLEMIRLKKNIFNRMIYDSFDPSSVTYTMPPTVSDTSEPSPKEMKLSGDDIETMADIKKFAPEIIQQEINLDDVKSLEDLPQNKVLEIIAKLGRFQTGGLSLPFDLTIKYAMGDYTPVTTSPGAAFDNVTLTAIENAHIKYPGRNSVSPDNYVNMPSRFAQAAFQHFDYEVTPKGIRVKDDFNFKDPNEGGSTSIGAFAALDDYLPNKIKAQTIATNLVKIGDKRAQMLGYDPRDDKFGIPINYLIPYRRLSQKQKKLFYPERFRNENKRGSAFSKIKKIRNK